MLWLPESWLNVAAPPNPHRKKKRKKAGVKAIPPAVHLVVRKRPVLSDHFLISKRSFYQDRLGTTIDGKLKTGTHRLFLQENALELPATVSIRQTSRCFSRDNQKRSLAETGSGEISAGDLNQRGCVSAGWRACADLDSELRSAAQDSGIAPASDHHLRRVARDEEYGGALNTPSVLSIFLRFWPEPVLANHHFPDLSVPSPSW
jgi:hypothetical protein